MKSRKFVFALMFGLGVVGAQETYSTWTHHKFVGLNTRPVGGGAGTTAEVRNFPVLVRLDSTNFSAGFAQSIGRGADLRFTKLGDVVRLPHQIERWDSAAKRAEIWVKVDTVKANIVGAIRMHWGKAGAADSSKGSAVFDTAQGFQAVWHLNETAADSARDATANRFHGVPSGTPGSAAGPVGLSRSFNGTSQHFQVPNSASGKLNFPLDGVFTFSAWASIDPNSAVVDRVIVAKHDNQYALKISTNNSWQFFEYDGDWQTVISPYETGRWTHLVGVLNGRDTYLYMDGVEAGSILDCCAGGGSRNETIDVFIGRAGESARRWWWGGIDEVRIASVARSAQWAQLEYANQKTPATMMLYADTMPVVSIAPGSFSESRMGTGSIRSAATGYLFQVPTGSHPTARFSVTDVRGHTAWNRTVATTNGQASASWNTSPGAGVYTVRMTVLDSRGKVVEIQVGKFSRAH